ncbi:MAG: hypothetical protein ACPGCN_05010, partial [bacterium]
NPNVPLFLLGDQLNPGPAQLRKNLLLVFCLSYEPSSDLKATCSPRKKDQFSPTNAVGLLVGL